MWTNGGARSWSPPHWPARVRRVLARRPWLYWLAIGALATGTYVAVGNHARRHDAARDRWGRTSPVLITHMPVAPGEPLADSVRRTEWPEALAPPGAVMELEPGTVARQHIGAGEAVTDADVAPGEGPLALVPAGWAAVPIVESPPSGAAVGERVRVAAEGVIVAADGLVVGTVAPDVTLVAVPEADAAVVSAAVEGGALVLLRAP